LLSRQLFGLRDRHCIACDGVEHWWTASVEMSTARDLADAITSGVLPHQCCHMVRRRFILRANHSHSGDAAMHGRNERRKSISVLDHGPATAIFTYSSTELAIKPAG
jgi:hypothetical protein